MCIVSQEQDIAGVTIIEALVGIAVVGILAMAIGGLTTMMTTNVRRATASGTRDMLRMNMLQFPLTNVSMLASSARPENDVFEDCYLNGNCLAGWQPISLGTNANGGGGWFWLSGPPNSAPPTWNFNPIGTSSDTGVTNGGPAAGGPARFDDYGVACPDPQTASNDCIFEVMTEYQAVCQAPCDPTPIPPIRPTGFNFRYVVKMAQSVTDLGGQRFSLGERKGTFYMDRVFIEFGN
jgi:hypothetical protein